MYITCNQLLLISMYLFAMYVCIIIYPDPDNDTIKGL